MDETPIFKFEGLKEKLKSLGYHIGETRAWTPIRGRDVVMNISGSDVSFDDTGDGGIKFIDENGFEHIGFLYMRSYRLAEHGKPRMHICKCSTLQEFIMKGSFEAEYRFAETATVIVSNRNNLGRDEDVSNLPLCKNCIRMLNYKSKFQAVANSSSFAKLMGTDTPDSQDLFAAQRSQDALDVDIRGYVKNWEIISKTVREEKQYTCEKCGLQISDPMDYEYMHVHHINGDKLDNRVQNLQCLCIGCHSQIDDIHIRNFSSRAQQLRLKIFNKKYGK